MASGEAHAARMGRRKSNPDPMARRVELLTVIADSSFHQSIWQLGFVQYRGIPVFGKNYL